MTTMAVLFAAIFLLNLIPAFAPPTWMAMSWIGFNLPEHNPLLLAVIAAVAATMGRLVLAQCSGWLVRGHLMREADRQNIDVVKVWLEKKKAITAGVLLLYAFSPFPSNYLFIAYGLTRLRLWLIGVPFFFGRLASYAVWAHFAQIAHSYLDPEMDLDGRYLGVYFIVTQLALLGFVFVLMRVDWNAALNEHRLRLRRPTPGRDTRA
jgi:membrane protein YqaA with SNARE-associated domain